MSVDHFPIQLASELQTRVGGDDNIPPRLDQTEGVPPVPHWPSRTLVAAALNPNDHQALLNSGATDADINALVLDKVRLRSPRDVIAGAPNDLLRNLVEVMGRYPATHPKALIARAYLLAAKSLLAEREADQRAVQAAVRSSVAAA